MAGEAQDSRIKTENKATGRISHAGEYVGKQTLLKAAARRVTQPSVSGGCAKSSKKKYIPFDPTIPHQDTYPTQIPGAVQKGRGTMKFISAFKIVKN